MRAGLAAPGAALLAGGALAAGAAAADGARGAGSAALGVVVVLGFFATGALPVLVVRGEEQRAGIGTAVLLLTYTLRLAVAVAVLRVAGRSDDVLPRWTGLAVIAAALAWVGAQAVVSLRPDGARPDGAG